MSASHTTPASSPVTVCLSCGTSFPHLDGATCGVCRDIDAGGEGKGKQCIECGRLFPRLNTAYCGYCLQNGYGTSPSGAMVKQIRYAMRELDPPGTPSQSQSSSQTLSASAVVQHAKDIMKELTNPRVDRPDLQCFVASLSPDAFTDASDRKQSAEIISALRESYVSAHHFVNDPENLQRPKVSSSAPKMGGKKPAQITVALDRIVVHVGTKTETIPFVSRSSPYPNEKRWDDILATFRGIAKRQVQERHSMDVDESQIVLCGLKGTSMSFFVDEWMTGSLGYLWLRKNHPTLHCAAVVTYTEEQAISLQQRRKAAKEITRSTHGVPSTESKRMEMQTSAFQTMIAAPYITQPVQSTRVIVERLDIVLASDNKLTTDIASTPLILNISIEAQQSGTTKKIYRATLGKEVFAAKCFYDLGKSNNIISNTDNRRHLENELSRHVIATNLGKQFLEYAQRSNIPVTNFTFSDSWIAVVKQGTNPGWCYLMAPMLSVQNIVKFSGTMVAGSNDSIPGRTMDVFAHFSLVSTQEKLILTDIQDMMGIRVWEIMGRRESKSSKSSIHQALFTSISTETQDPLYPPTTISSGKRSRKQSVISSGTHLSNKEDAKKQGFEIESYQCGITFWGRQVDGDGQPVEGKMIPKKGEEVTGSLRISLDQGELYNMNRSKFWNVTFSKNEVAAAYTSHIAIAPEGTSIIAELHRFHNLQSLYEEFETLTKSRNVEIMKLGFDYKLIRIRSEVHNAMEWLCAPILAVSQVFYADFDTESENALINDTLEAFLHFLYEHFSNGLVHTSWAYMRTADSCARIIAAMTHDQHEISREDEESLAAVVTYFPHNFEAAGIMYWNKKYQCG